MFSKPHLMSDGIIIPGIEILAYLRVRSDTRVSIQGTLVEHIKLIKLDAKSRRKAGLSNMI